MLLSGIFAWALSTKVDVLYKRSDPHSAPAGDREPAVDRGHVPART
jgi:hypothetical protein